MATPFQNAVRRLIRRYEERHGAKLSGRELSLRVGKSPTHLSQILNDGLIPSGKALLALGRALDAAPSEIRDLLVQAMKTKARGRARDTFWLDAALEMSDELVHEISELRGYLESRGLLSAYDEGHQRRRRPGKEKSTGLEA